MMSTELKSITVLLYDFIFKNENFATFTFVVKDMFNLLSKTSKDFLTSLSNFFLKYYTIIDFNEVDIRIYLPKK